MGISFVIAFVSFFGMTALVLQNHRRISQGRVHELAPMNMYDLVRPTVDVWKNTVRSFGHMAWAQILKLSHIVTFKIGKKFLEIAWMVRGKRKRMTASVAPSSIWKEVAYEKERIRAHFARQESVVR